MTKIVGKDYNSIDWKSLVELEPSSPSGIKYVATVRRWGKQQPGSYCGSADSTSGWRLSVKGDRYLVHRIIMILLNGSLSDEEVVDHLDGDPFNNTLDNLQVKTQRENNQNVKQSTRNSSGCTGVFPWKDSRTGEITAYVTTWVSLDQKPRRKFFAFSKYTEQGALESAIDFRKKMIQELIDQGMAYTSRHGEK